ncbi:hypothetical protein MYSTI_00799 [Myxococcus stipitatus DSM 14675]|uniref:Lipoprotein n=1 Tax=Myxococcus stipitatus (strain DSM 14675 / JCM 12634 / Mx s8) TaxID=1278073 RepID=L7U1S6_MYXSD|nr:hypothetical protein [Myxococcus stipitatus]AGC42148.1 hypothetical protein MYSTI_00799 [Myxococcus stipitatus DSM 14675]
MRATSLPIPPVVFHVLALVFFGGCAAWLVQESQMLGGRRGWMAVAVAVASVGAALLSLSTLVALLRARALVVLGIRAPVGAYLQALAVVGLLVLLGVHLVYSGTRPALGSFCLGLAVWLGALGLHLVPGLYLAQDGFIDLLGRRTRFSELEWFSLQKGEGAPPRLVLQVGRGTSLRLEARLTQDAVEGVKGRLIQAGLSARTQGR